MGGIKVTATQAFHSSSIALDEGTLAYGGEPLGYVVEFEGGFKVNLAGHNCLRRHVPDWAEEKMTELPRGRASGDDPSVQVDMARVTQASLSLL